MKKTIQYYKNIKRNYRKAKLPNTFIDEVFMQLAYTKRNKEILEETLKIIREKTNPDLLTKLDFHMKVEK